MRVAVIGLGVMGGSLARRLVGSSHDVAASPGDAEGTPSVAGWAADATDRMAAASAGVHIGEDVRETVREADVVVLATPLSTLPELASAVTEAAPPRTLVMDVASLQEPALGSARAASLSDRWVSAHPMVGSERSGFDASSADLYDAATVYLSADEGISSAMRDAAMRFWTGVGADAEWVDPRDHDDRMATVSHLPQVVATALADTIAASGLPVEALGPGGRDTTRLAASSVSMWGDLYAHAGPTLVNDLRELARRLEEDASALESGEAGAPVDRLERAGAWRRGR